MPQLQRLGHDQADGAAVNPWLKVFLALLLGRALAEASRWTMLQLGRIDQPNTTDVGPAARRLHQHATPRGGLLALALLLVIYTLYLQPGGAFWLIPAMAILGLLDDLSPQPAALRLLMQTALMCVAISQLGDPWPDGPVLWIRIACVLGAVWIVNAANFLDGANGLLSGLMILFLIFLPAIGMSKSTSTLLMAALLAGFFTMNFPRARVFMGDVGSYLIGGMLAWFSLHAAHQSAPHFFSVLILMSPFLLDPTCTLLVRTFAGKRVWQAHSEHTYQLLLKAGIGVVKLLLLHIVYFLMSLALANYFYRQALSPQSLAGLLCLWTAFSVGSWLLLRRWAAREIAIGGYMEPKT
jgi:UDP-N-acetylmuramyl pentapeptide phosphotransferase/UDP-N-acetylglucosamine-1-phosphate transferase